MRLYCILLAFNLTLAIGCKSKPKAQWQLLTVREHQIFDSLKIDSTLIPEIRKYNDSEIEAFHYSLSKSFKNGKEIDDDPIYLRGIVFKEKYKRSDELVLRLSTDFKKKGYSIFVLERNFNINNQPDNIGVLKTTDKYEVLRQIQTDGVNHNITNDSLLKIIKQFDNKYSLDLVGASGDWCEFVINKEPANWMIFAKEVYKVCPDVVDQGMGTVQALADEMKKTKRLYFWWD